MTQWAQFLKEEFRAFPDVLALSRSSCRPWLYHAELATDGSTCVPSLRDALSTL